jgi:hypothetical protein
VRISVFTTESAPRRHLRRQAGDNPPHLPAARARPEPAREIGLLPDGADLPDADTASTFTASRLFSRNAAFTDSEHAQVLSRLGFAINELGYERSLSA